MVSLVFVFGMWGKQSSDWLLDTPLFLCDVTVMSRHIFLSDGGVETTAPGATGE